MTASLLLSRLVRLVRRRPPPPADLLDPYAEAVLPLADRAETLYHQWFEHTALVSDSEKLANAAAIHRWESATLARRLERVNPPTQLEGDHARLIEAIQLASRASQLLSSGSRYHNANALCEGQMLLTESRTRRLKALALLRRFVRERPRIPEAPPPPPPDTSPAPDEQPSAGVAPAVPAPPSPEVDAPAESGRAVSQ